MAVNGKEETLNLSETEDKWLVQCYSGHKVFVQIHSLLETHGGTDVDLCLSSNNSFPAVVEMYIRIYIYSKGKCSESVSVRLQEADG